MTGMGWIVVLGAVGAYALLWFAWWKGFQRGPREWNVQNASARRLGRRNTTGRPVTTSSNAGLTGPGGAHREAFANKRRRDLRRDTCGRDGV
jgi:hypothetical protein